MDKKKILLTYIESGMGHITSIASIADNLKKFGEKFELIESYIMQEDNDKSLKNWENFIIKQTKNTNRIKGFGNFVFWFLWLMGGVRFMRGVHRCVFAKYLKHCLEAFKKRDPDVIVSTHYFLTFAALEYKRKVNPNVKVVTYNPDNNVHCWWDNRPHLFFVNNENAYYEAIGKRKFAPSCVKQVNYIARDDILNANLSREEYREKLGISKDKFCVVVADGVYACAKSKKITDELLKTDKDLTIVMLAGKNEKLFKYYNDLKDNGKVKKNIDLIVLPFTKNIYEYYKAADVFITKAGPNAILDSVFMGTPVLVDYYAHPIEKATTKLFVDTLQMGKAIYKPKKIKKQVEAWIEDGSELLLYEANTAKINKFENGGKELADLINRESELKEYPEAKSFYQNHLYQLASQGKFESYSTPINYKNVRKDVDYKRIIKPTFFGKIFNGIIKGILFIFAPLINFFGFGLKIKGRKNIKGIKKAITVSNHVHQIDCLWVMQILRGKKWAITGAPHNFKKGLGGAILKAGGLVPLPSAFSQSKEFCEYVRLKLAKKGFLHFYSEQALWLRYTQSRPYKKGAFYYATQNNVPVVPIVYCYRDSHKKKPKRVTAVVCEPIYPKKDLSERENAIYLMEEAQKVYDKTVVDFYGYDKETYDVRKMAIKK